MEPDRGYDPSTDEYTAGGAMIALDISRATLDRWIPASTEGRRLTEPAPGRPAQVRIKGDLVRAFLPLPAGEGAVRE
jgi:hypothetical protein